MDKLREWWITKPGKDPVVKGLVYAHEKKYPNTVHVIEYSAYEKLKLELDAAVEGLRRIEKYVAHNGDTWVQESARAVLASLSDFERGEK